MSTPLVRLDHAICADAEQADQREWLLTNGLGGYASGTVSGVLTRRYHGLLVASVDPPLGRFLLVAKADAVLIDGQEQIPLHTNRWRGGITAPNGQQHIRSFRLDGQMPVWDYAINELCLEQRVWMDHGHNQTRVGFRWKDGEREKGLVIRLGLIASYRDHHAVNRPNGFDIDTELMAAGLRLHLPSGRLVEIRANQGRFSLDGSWIEGFYLARERERGLGEIDHHLRVGYVDLPLARDSWVGISLSLGPATELEVATSLLAEQARVASLLTIALPGVDPDTIPDWVRQLVIAADCYLFQRQEPNGGRKRSVIAGYPWFGDWGRDTMIALPGLTLATGRSQLAREILTTFAGYVSQGMLPNVFPGSGGIPHYNTVDAALWFVEAWRAYVAATGDIVALRGAFGVLAEIVHAYRDGTRYGICMDPGDGLISAGIPGQQLTWMDARVNGREVTPRHGKPVEINALWYNALRSMASFACALGQSPVEFDRLAGKVSKGFHRYQRGGDTGLYDVLDGPDGHEVAIRPNQILAVSLPFSPLNSIAAQRAVVTQCRAHLLTPFGLRSLSPHDPRYHGSCTGGVEERDGAYHQGPVWGWLLGHYALAEFRVTGKAGAARQRLASMAEHLQQAGLGQISEIFDGDPPNAPRGVPAQAWSVACTLEAWWRLAREATK